jgi:hypothetical protein
VQAWSRSHELLHEARRLTESAERLIADARAIHGERAIAAQAAR